MGNITVLDRFSKFSTHFVLVLVLLFPSPSDPISGNVSELAVGIDMPETSQCEGRSTCAVDAVCVAGTNFTFYNSGLTCGHNFLINYQNHDIFRIMEDDEVQVGLEILVDYPYQLWMSVDVDSYCVLENVSIILASLIANETVANIFPENGSNVLIYCNIRLNGFDNFLLHRRIHGVIKIVQGSISLLTFLPYLILYKFQNATGGIQAAFFLALGLDCVFSGVYNFIYDNDLELKTQTFCEVTAAAIQIVEIATYASWATGHYDMLRMVWSNNKIMRQGRVEYTRLAIYISTGWGIPITIVSGGFLCSHFNKDGTSPALHFDTQTLQRCPPPITTSVSTFIIQVSFLAASIIFFITMVVLIRKHQKESGVAVQSIKKRYGREVKTFVNLTLVVGLPFVSISILELALGEGWAGSWFLVGDRLFLLGTVVYACHTFGYNAKNRALFFKEYKFCKKVCKR